ncbi:MAG: VOC family protein [Acidimicrobiales bacterium]
MSERTSYVHGTPSWVDLSTVDPSASKSFYSALFGWEWDENPTEQGSSYFMAQLGGKAVAGMMQQPAEQTEMGIPSMWNTYVTVADIDATLAKVNSVGGSVMMPKMQVMESGQMAVVVDPTGAVICLWQAGDHIGAELVNQQGTLAWNELQTSDVGAATTFYKELFGWNCQVMDMGMGDYTIFELGEEGVCGAMNPPMEGIPAHWSTVFAVDDCNGTVETANSSGGSVVAEPFDIPIGRIAVLADPAGAVFQIIQMTAESP